MYIVYEGKTEGLFLSSETRIWAIWGRRDCATFRLQFFYRSNKDVSHLVRHYIRIKSLKVKILSRHHEYNSLETTDGNVTNPMTQQHLINMLSDLTGQNLMWKPRLCAPRNLGWCCHSPGWKKPRVGVYCGITEGKDVSHPLL